MWDHLEDLDLVVESVPPSVEMNEAEIPTDEWPELIPFEGGNLPAFPVLALPVPLREWVEAVSESAQVPADLPALLSLAVCAFPLSRNVTVKAGWEEPTNLFTAILLPPASRKSAVFRDCLAPLEAIEADLIESERLTVARAQSERRQKEKTLASLEKKAADGDQPSRHEASQLAEELATERMPVLPRLIADHATAERLESLLAEQEGRIMSASPEGGVFDLMAGQYSKTGTPQIEIYLKGHAGDALRTDRVGRESVRIDEPALTCAYAVQPEVMRTLAGNRTMSGRGLWARFLFAIPHTAVGYREIDTAPVPARVRDAYRETVIRLYYDTQPNTVLTLSSEAAAVFREWRTEAEAMLRAGGELEAIPEWGGKLPGATLRIAAVLHAVESGSVGEIGVNAIRSAIEISRYLIPHAEAVLTMASAASTVIGDAEYVLKWAVRHSRQEFSKSEAQHHGKRRFPKANDIDAALAELVRRGFIRSQATEKNGPGRPASPTYEVNPAAFDDTKPPMRSQYSQNSKSEPESGLSGNIGNAFQHSETEMWGEV